MTKKIKLTLDLEWRVMQYLLLLLTFFFFSCDGPDQSQPMVKETDIASSIQSKSKVEKEVNFDKGVYCGFLDSEGILWFGSNGNGLYRYDGTSFTHLTEDDGICNNQVFSITEDKEETLMLGTGNGLCSFDRETFTHISIPFSDTSSAWLDKVYLVINPNAVQSLVYDNGGNLWIGTGGGGAYSYDGISFTSYLSEIGRKQEDGLYHNWIPGVTKDGEGNIWFASMTHGGVSRFDGETFTYFMPEDGLTDDMVRTIYKDKSGNIWIGYNGNRESGLTCYNGKSMINYYEKDGLCSKNIMAIYEDKKGNLWLGGGRGKLCVFDGSTFSEFTTKEGQQFDGILCIIEDVAGNIWFGGGDGLWAYNGIAVTDMTNSNG